MAVWGEKFRGAYTGRTVLGSSMNFDLYLGCVYFDKTRGGPNRGVWAVDIYQSERRVLTIWKRERDVTSNHAALTGILTGIHLLVQEGLMPTASEEWLTIHTIFQYIARGITQWSGYWMENEYRTKTSGKPIRNLELWRELLTYRPNLMVRWYAKGTNPIINELLDFCWEQFDDDTLPTDYPEGATWLVNPQELKQERLKIVPSAI